MPSLSWRAVLVAAIAGLAGAFRSDAPAPPPGGHALVVTAYEYTFIAPDSAASGMVTIRLVNRGKEAHQVTFARLDDSSSLPRVMRSLVRNADHTGGIRWAGGVERALPGASSETSVLLKPGRYVMVCAYGAEDGHAHMSRGMIRGLVVSSGAPSTNLVLPVAPVTIRLTDYRISISGELRAGRQLVRVENVGRHLHQLSFSRLVGNTTMEQLDKWDGKSKPSPIEGIGGGAAPMDTGQVSVISIALRPGRYVLDCGLSDTTGAKPHYMLGMEREITVK